MERVSECEGKTSFLFLKTARTTLTQSVWVVKCFKPSMPFNCWRQISTAVPPIKPVIVECDRTSTKIPNLQNISRQPIGNYVLISGTQLFTSYSESSLFLCLSVNTYSPKYAQRQHNQTRNEGGCKDQTGIQYGIFRSRYHFFY